VLKNEFAMEDGLGTIGIEVLDFACGTGTFLLELYKQVLGRIPNKKLGENSKEGTIINHLLQKVYGFELMIAPYAIAHLKLSQYLKQEGFDFKKPIQKGLAQDKKRDEYFYRIPVFLTNTLENLDWEYKQKRGNQVTLPFFSFIEEVAKEGAKAQKIKDSKNVFVIMGNPPYNGTSMNHSDYITNLMQDYFAIDGVKMKEQNSKWVNDDYVKFIRFAEDKIAKHPHGGVVGVITPHGFLDNPTFRAMRKHLMQTFDKMYFVDLHGNTRKKEVDLEGGKDENVFNIMQGVCISIFVKTSNVVKDKCKIYTLDIYGKRKQKNEQLLNSNIDDCEKVNLGWQEVNPVTPFYLFKKQDEDLRSEYDKFISLEDIFNVKNVGIVTGKDDKVIAFSKNELISKIRTNFNMEEQNDKIKKINYRTFDERFVYYCLETKGLIERGRKDVMSHFLDRENMGLVFCRRTVGSFEHCFVNNILMEACFISNRGNEINYIAPLYLYDDFGNKTPNFKPEFLRYLTSRLMGGADKFDYLSHSHLASPVKGEGQKEATSSPLTIDVSTCNAFLTSPLTGEVGELGSSGEGVKQRYKIDPEQILSYIYAVLHSQNYRTKYLEFLKIDFARIPFDVEIETFEKLSNLGQELIDLHLLKTIPNTKFGEAEWDETRGEKNYVVERISHQNDRLYFNQSCYFANVSTAVWNFKIGGYQVLDKYLKSRKGLDIFDDLSHIQKIIKSLQSTIEIMQKIDLSIAF